MCMYVSVSVCMPVLAPVWMCMCERESVCVYVCVCVVKHNRLLKFAGSNRDYLSLVFSCINTEVTTLSFSWYAVRRWRLEDASFGLLRRWHMPNTMSRWTHPEYQAFLQNPSECIDMLCKIGNKQKELYPVGIFFDANSLIHVSIHIFLCERRISLRGCLHFNICYITISLAWIAYNTELNIIISLIYIYIYIYIILFYWINYEDYYNAK